MKTSVSRAFLVGLAFAAICYGTVPLVSADSTNSGYGCCQFDSQCPEGVLYMGNGQYCNFMCNYNTSCGPGGEGPYECTTNVCLWP